MEHAQTEAEQPQPAPDPLERARGILGRPLTIELLQQLDWQAQLPDLGLDVHRWHVVTHLSERAKALAADGASDLSMVCRLLSAAISMHLNVNGSEPFIAALRMSDGRSAAPEDLDANDVLTLQMLAEQASSPWLRARLGDLACVAGPTHGIPSWTAGALAARAYLEHARSEGEEHDVERRECLQRAMELGWRYLKKDQEFHAQLWDVAVALMVRGMGRRAPGVAFPLAHEIVKRNARLAPKAAAILEQHADLWAAEGSIPLSSHTYREAARLWHVAKDSNRARVCHHKAAEVLIALARGPGQAMLQADWMLEGIAVLRRHQGDRAYIKELQAELADIRHRITGEMHTISHEVDATEIVDHVRSRVTSDNLFDALLQVAFAFSKWAEAGKVRSRIIKTSERYVFQNLFQQVTYNSEGVPVAISEPFDAANEDELEKRMIHDVSEFDHPLLARVAIRCAIDVLQTKFEPTMADVMGILHQSPVTPHGHEWSLARGLLAGLNHDWHEAAIFLIPQAEPFVRAAFKRNGIHTLSKNAEGAEEEKSLSELLDHPDINSVLHSDIVLELKALLTHKSGHNLRNRYGHGLITDDDLANVGTIVLWWTMLRLILWPFQERMIELLRAREGAAESAATPDAEP